MKVRKGITVGAAVCILLGSVMNVSAAEPYSDQYVSTLIKNRQESLIIDVEAYKASYDDLARSFGDNPYAYVNHYLTVGVYEGRTKGVLFDPLIYAESYSDVKEAFGHDISSIVEHYLKFGITEKRTQGTAQGYCDIAAAEKAGALNTNVNRDVDGSMSVAGNTTSINVSVASVTSAATANSDYVNNNSTTNYDTSAEGSSLNENYAVADNSSLNSSNASNDSSTPTSSNSIPVSNNSVAADGNSSSVSVDNSYYRTTSIYDNDETTLLRVEYYNENNQLINYSVVTDFDSSSNSYTETIYDSNCVLERTDVYVNGSLSSSEAP